MATKITRGSGGHAEARDDVLQFLIQSRKEALAQEGIPYYPGWQKRHTIAEATGRSLAAVDHALYTLEKQGLIERCAIYRTGQPFRWRVIS